MYGYKDEVCTEYVYVLHGSWAHNIMATHNQVTGRANEQDSPLSMTYHAGGHAALLLVCTDIAMCIHTESVAMPKTKAMGNTMFTCGRALIQLFVEKCVEEVEFALQVIRNMLLLVPEPACI